MALRFPLARPVNSANAARVLSRAFRMPSSSMATIPMSSAASDLDNRSSSFGDILALLMVRLPMDSRASSLSSNLTAFRLGAEMEAAAEVEAEVAWAGLARRGLDLTLSASSKGPLRAKNESYIE